MTFVTIVITDSISIRVGTCESLKATSKALACRSGGAGFSIPGEDDDGPMILGVWWRTVSAIRPAQLAVDKRFVSSVLICSYSFRRGAKYPLTHHSANGNHNDNQEQEPGLGKDIRSDSLLQHYKSPLALTIPFPSSHRSIHTNPLLSEPLSPRMRPSPRHLALTSVSPLITPLHRAIVTMLRGTGRGRRGRKQHALVS